MKKISKDEIVMIIEESYTIADVCRKLGWKPSGANYKTIHRYIDEYNLDISHFTGSRTNIGNRLNKHLEKKSVEYLKEKSYIASRTLKWKLFSEGVKEYKCEKCGCNEWNSEQIALQLHHINGDDTDNRLENLQILCPNCHSQTDNFCGRNIKTKSKYNRKYFCRVCGKEIEKTLTKLCNDCYKLLINNELKPYDVTINEKLKIYTKCEECGEEVIYGCRLCNKCKGVKSRKTVWPSKEELLKLIHEKSFTSIGKIYGVSDNAVRKWCKKYNLPYRKKDFN